MSSGRFTGFLHQPFLPPWSHRKDERASWPETTATVADCLDLSGVWARGHATADLYTIRFTYWVDDRMHTGCFKSRIRYAPGETLMVRYDPRHPERNSTDPEEKLRTELLVGLAAVVAALYFILVWHF